MRVSICSPRPLLRPSPLERFEYQLDPYVGCGHLCHYCYVLDEAETDWSEELLRYEDIGTQLAAELEGAAPQTIYMGYYSDPYQPCEAELRQTRTALERLAERGHSVSILTKSDLVLRDIDILRTMPDANVSVSVAFQDDRDRRRFEAGTIETSKRITALRLLREAGIATGALVCPVIPYVSDAPRLVDELAPHVDTIWVYRLSVQDPNGRCWENVRSILSEHYPELQPAIEKATMDPEHASWEKLREVLARERESGALDLRSHI